MVSMNSAWIKESIYSISHSCAREKNKPIQFPKFLDIICSRVGETKTKDGLRRVFALFDKDENGVIDFEEFRAIGKQLHENLNDDDIMEKLSSGRIIEKVINYGG
jgi:centrin-1